MSDGPHSLYPGFIKLYYTVSTFEHVMTIPVRPFVNSFGFWWVEMKGTAGGILWTSGLTALVDAIKIHYHTSTTFTYAELWTMDSVEADPLYRETYLLGVAGTSVTANVLMSQTVFSGRSSAGGVAKLYLMESINAVNQKLKPAYAAGFATTVSYLLGNSSILTARDGGTWSAVPQVTTKTNDKLRRQRGLA